jgi:predicted  nucleic acid-binding Zn-ribbon protein
MKQENLLLQLQELLHEEYIQKGKQELRPLINSLRKLQEEIKQAETRSLDLQKKIAEMRKELIEVEAQTDGLNDKIGEAREKLYGAKGGSLKELLSLQQSVQKMEEEIAKTETRYLEKANLIDELIKSREQTNESIKEMKRSYNKDIKIYKEKNQQIESNLANNLEKQIKIKEKFNPEVLSIFMETAKRFPANPVALLKGQICSGCHISIPSVLQIRIMEAKKLHICDSCGRILIYKKDV